MSKATKKTILFALGVLALIDAGTALSGGDLGADGALDSSSLNQIFH